MITNLLFVYGTLKSNQSANFMLENSLFYGMATTAPNYALYSCGSFPAMVEKNPGRFIEGEVYGITSDVKNKLDIYEGVSSGHYELVTIRLHKIGLQKLHRFPDLPIQSYLYRNSVNHLKEIFYWR